MSAEDREIRLSEIRAKLGSGDARSAAKAAKSYLSKYPGDAEAQKLAGVAYAQIDRFVDAERHLALAYAIDDSQYDVGVMLLRAKMELGRWEDALGLAQKLRRENPNDRVVQVMLASVLDHVAPPDVGWERAENMPTHRVEFTGNAEEHRRR